MKKIVLTLILGIIVILVVLWYIISNPDKYQEIYYKTTLGYLGYYINNRNHNKKLYNTYYLNDINIIKPVVIKLCSNEKPRIYIIPDTLVHEYLLDSVNFSTRTNVYECWKEYLANNQCFSLFNWRKVHCGFNSLFYDDEYFSVAFKLKQKIGDLEVYDFIFPPEGFIYVLSQEPIQKFYEDNIITINFHKDYKPYIIPYFSKKDQRSYYNYVMDKV